jgi:signal transduction histidine kinase
MRITPDTVSIDTLNLVFRAALEQAGRPLKFIIKHEKTLGQNGSFRRMEWIQGDSDVEHRIYDNTIYLDPVRINPLSRYQASMLNIQAVLLKEIAPQILFSFFLTALTLLAFVVLYRNLRAQQRLMELKNDFISNMTHELKTPVSTVSVALEALKNFHGLDNPTRTQEYLEIAQNELNRLTLMTDKILKAAVFENQRIVLHKEAVDLKVVTEKIVDAMKVLFEKHHAQVSLKTEGDNFIVNGEETHLTNVIYNLIDNALKYSSQHPVVTITLRESGGGVEFIISDNGIGIPAAYQKKIFEKFFRVPTGDVHNAKGYGLGLSYVASVVKSHGGSIELESDASNGSSFRIIFPAKSN